jgi:hypothetical protein
MKTLIPKIDGCYNCPLLIVKSMKGFEQNSIQVAFCKYPGGAFPETALIDFGMGNVMDIESIPPDCPLRKNIVILMIQE